jgi:hypothetical protein
MTLFSFKNIELNCNLSQEDQQEDPSPDGKTISGMT